MIAVEGGSKPQTGGVADLGRGDVRWRKRFDNVQRALQVLERSATRLAFQNSLAGDGEGLSPSEWWKFPGPQPRRSRG